MAGFADDLYRGTAEAYEQYRRPYPPGLTAALVDQAALDETSTVLDLACGTGQVARALAPHVGWVIAVDQEPEFVELARRTDPAIDWRAGRAEEVAIAEPVDLITIGNAFHRLDADITARRAWELLDPAGALALLWTHTPWRGDRPWQRAMADTVWSWTSHLGTDVSTPEPDPLPQVLFRNGFATHARVEVGYEESWTVDELVGFVRSTSILSPRALGARAGEFESELRSALALASTDERLVRTTTAALDLARPADATAHAGLVRQHIGQLTGHTPVVVAIDGRSGGGKSTLAAEIARSLPNCSVIDGDDFYSGGSDQYWDSTSAPEKVEFGIDWLRQRPVLESLRRGEPGSWHGFDWDLFDGSLDREPTICEPADVIILEGAYSARPELADLIDLRVLVDVPYDVRRDRCVARDGDDWHEDWFQRWRAAEDHYFDTVVPATGFDLVLRG